MFEDFDSENMKKMAGPWGDFYRSGAGNLYPDENLIRLVRGQYAEIPRSGRVLDVGFGVGGNLLFFAQEGFDAYGLEVSEESIKAGRSLSEKAAVNLELGLLEGTEINYPDSFFDIVVSWNAVYYYGTRTLVKQAIHEFYRVLKPGGVLLISVMHPNALIAGRLSDDLGDGARRMNPISSSDARSGMAIFYDRSSSGWRRLLDSFDEIEEGYAEADLFNPNRRDAWRLFLARKIA